MVQSFVGFGGLYSSSSAAGVFYRSFLEGGYLGFFSVLIVVFEYRRIVKFLYLCSILMGNIVQNAFLIFYVLHLNF